MAPRESRPACISGASTETAEPTSSRATSCKAVPTSEARANTLGGGAFCPHELSDESNCSTALPPGKGANRAALEAMRASICRSVGKSKMSVSGSSASSPSLCERRLRSSVAPSESSPACISGASAETAEPTSSRATFCKARPNAGPGFAGRPGCVLSTPREANRRCNATKLGASAIAAASSLLAAVAACSTSLSGTSASVKDLPGEGVRSHKPCLAAIAHS